MSTAIAPLEQMSTSDRSRAVWSAGDYSRIAISGQIAADQLADALAIEPGQSVLDVGTGSGNFALAAASRWADTTAIDIVPEILRVADSRLEAQWLHANFDIASAEALPYSNETFEVAASTFGLMFAADQQEAANEILRVTRANGKIGLASWCPDGFMGQLIEIISQYRPSAWQALLPTQWGTRDRITELFGDAASHLQIQHRQLFLRFRSADHWLSLYHRNYGPLRETFATLNPRGVALLTKDLLNLVREHNHSNEGTMIVPCDYLQVIIYKR